MVWIVKVSDKALKHLQKFDNKLQREIISILEMFKWSPFPRGLDIKKLRGIITSE